MRFLYALAIALIGFSAFADDLPDLEKTPGVSRAGLSGIDVSHRQNDVDWSRVAAACVHFRFIKATEGEGLKDARFRENFDGAKAAGLIRGTYHFFRPGKDAEAQAESFLHVVSSLSPGDLPPVSDVEIGAVKDSKSILDGIQTWVEAVENVLGRQPILYTYPSFWTQTLRDRRRIPSYCQFATERVDSRKFLQPSPMARPSATWASP